MKMPLLVMRLKDMHRVHPEQIESICARCGEIVAVYPSGQRIMRFFPGQIELVCQVCQPPPADGGVMLAPGAELEPFESKRKERDMKKYPGFRIKHVHAIVAIGEDDEEGVCSHLMGGVHMPLIAANEERLQMITSLAQRIADATGQKFEIVRFTTREHIGEIRSKKVN